MTPARVEERAEQEEGRRREGTEEVVEEVYRLATRIDGTAAFRGR